MDRVKSLIPIGVLFAFSLKYLVYGCGWPESLVFLCLSAIYLYSEYFNHNKKIEIFRSEINELDKQFKAVKAEFEETRGELNALKVKNFTTSAIIRK